MINIGIIICNRYAACGGGKCFRAFYRRHGGFSRYSLDDNVRIVGYTACGGCPGGNIELVMDEMVSNGATTIHFATGMIVGFPPCPFINELKQFIETRYKISVVPGTHPIPFKYYQTHKQLPFWQTAKMSELAESLLNEDIQVMQAYD